MKLAALISGGKDSLYALYTMSKENEIAYLLTVFPEREDSYMFHHPNVGLTKLQAEAMGIPLITQTTKGEKERELEDLKKLFSKVKGKVDGIVSGALASRYQKQRIDRLCEELGLKSIAPLWGISGDELWKRLLENRFEVIVTSVSAMGLSKEWLGRRIDYKAFEELKKIAQRYRFHLGFEGGEAETLVLDTPLFKRKIIIRRARKVWDKKSNTGKYLIEEAELINKS